MLRTSRATKESYLRHGLRFAGLVLLLLLPAGSVAVEPAPDLELSLQIPQPGTLGLRALTPTLLEVTFVSTKAPDPAPVQSWDLVSAKGLLTAPEPENFQVLAYPPEQLVKESANPGWGLAPATATLPGATQVLSVEAVGFQRRVRYAPLAHRDLRIANRLYLRLATSIPNNSAILLRDLGGSLWGTNQSLMAPLAPLRLSPAIHVNQVGYGTTFFKKAIVGYYLGSLGELDLPAAAGGFQLLDAQSGAVVFQGPLTPRHDTGYLYSPTPYQRVWEADFSPFGTPGLYRLAVPGLGASYPFRIDPGIALAFARTYALGLYHQRCGTNNALPFTRFTHEPCHLAPASVPLPANDFAFTWNTISNYASTPNPDNPLQAAPLLTSPAAQLYPFVHLGPVDVSGGHHDAGDYSKYTLNSAAFIHYLMFAVDALPGVAALDNLGLPESGDGISDLLQEAKWEADFLAKLQDADGGFYFLVYPRERQYESDVLPEQGDPQVVWPKNTTATAVAVAALAQCASSPHFKQAFPQAAAAYWAQAQLGWNFLTNALAQHGRAGAYQKLTAYGDDFTDQDELAWAACEMYVATGDPAYQAALFSWFPDPGDQGTWRWGWWRLFGGYGCAVRDYAFAARSGRLSASQLDTNYLAGCEGQIVACAQDHLAFSQANAYGSSFPLETKAVRAAGWYFSNERAFDLAVAAQLAPRQEFGDALLRNLNYEGGCNPVNVCYVTGLGWRRQREVVSQYAQNDRRVLPPTGLDIGNIQAAFDYLYDYQSELGELSFPSDGSNYAPYPYYDRWADTHNVTTECTSVDLARSLASLAWVATQSTGATQAWTYATATISGLPANVSTNAAVTATVNVPGLDLSQAVMVWEARDQEPAFGTNFNFAPQDYGPQWVEVEAQWPDGRRVFASTNFFATNTLPTVSVTTSQTNAAVVARTPAAFTFLRTGPTNADLTVNFRLGGTAVKFADYRRPEGDMPESVVLSAGSASTTLTIVPVDNPSWAGDKTVILTLLTNALYNVDAANSALVMLHDDRFRITNLAQDSTGNGVVISWISRPGASYQVASKSGFADPNWTMISPLLLATNASTTWRDTNSLLPQRLYRLLRIRSAP